MAGFGADAGELVGGVLDDKRQGAGGWEGFQEFAVGHG